MPPAMVLAELSAKGIDADLVERVKSIISKALISEESFAGGMATSYIRKAFRTGAWKKLNPISRALLLAVSMWRGMVKSKTLRGILTRIYVEIELHTVRGKAIFYGVLIALSRARELLLDPARNLKLLIVMGIQYMNLPTLLRIYG